MGRAKQARMSQERGKELTKEEPGNYREAWGGKETDTKGVEGEDG